MPPSRPFFLLERQVRRLKAYVIPTERSERRDLRIWNWYCAGIGAKVLRLRPAFSVASLRMTGFLRFESWVRRLKTHVITTERSERRDLRIWNWYCAGIGAKVLRLRPAFSVAPLRMTGFLRFESRVRRLKAYVIPTERSERRDLRS